MAKTLKFGSRLGMLISLLGPLLGLLLYPNAKWLFALVFVGIGIVVLNQQLTKDPAPDVLADQIERLLNGNLGAWDVDNFEHEHISDPQLRDLWRKSMEIGGHPEEWVRLDEEKKGQLRDLIRNLRKKP